MMSQGKSTKTHKELETKHMDTIWANIKANNIYSGWLQYVRHVFDPEAYPALAALAPSATTGLLPLIITHLMPTYGQCVKTNPEYTEEQYNSEVVSRKKMFPTSMIVRGEPASLYSLVTNEAVAADSAPDKNSGGAVNSLVLSLFHNPNRHTIHMVVVNVFELLQANSNSPAYGSNLLSDVTMLLEVLDRLYSGLAITTNHSGKLAMILDFDEPSFIGKSIWHNELGGMVARIKYIETLLAIIASSLSDRTTNLRHIQNVICEAQIANPKVYNDCTFGVPVLLFAQRPLPMQAFINQHVSVLGNQVGPLKTPQDTLYTATIYAPTLEDHTFGTDTSLGLVYAPCLTPAAVQPGEKKMSIAQWQHIISMFTPLTEGNCAFTPMHSSLWSLDLTLHKSGPTCAFGMFQDQSLDLTWHKSGPACALDKFLDQRLIQKLVKSTGRARPMFLTDPEMCQNQSKA